MVRLSLAMIVKDEEATLARVLADAATFCDELIVVDTGSTDATVAVAEAAGARVLSAPWTDDFAAARNVSFDAATGDWIIWLDADDRVPEPVQQALLRAKTDLFSDDFDALMVAYRYAFDGADNAVVSHLRERVLRRAAQPRWFGAVHEYIPLEPARVRHRDDIYVEHRPDPARRALNRDRNLTILQTAIAGGDTTARTVFYMANELRAHGRDADAVGYYERFLLAPTSGWERYSALLWGAGCYGRMGDVTRQRRWLLEALGADPARAEAYCDLAMTYYLGDDFATALPLFAAATTCRRPLDGFVNTAAYGWLPWDFLSVCYYRTGQPAAAWDALGRAAALNPERARVKDNAGWIIEQMAEQARAAGE